MSENNGKKARFAPGSTQEVDSYEYHWFVSNSFYWSASDSLLSAIYRLLDLSRLLPTNVYAATPINVWRVPGRNAGTHYGVEFYTPQIEGAVFVGTTRPGEGHLMTDNGPVKMKGEVS